MELSRNIFFYRELKLKDNFETRIILIFLHLSIILLIFKKEKKINFPQEIFDNIFLNVEYNMRELGHGDVSVNKKMKILNRIFYNILLKIDLKNSDFFSINDSVIKEHLFTEIKESDQIMSKIKEYLLSFYNYCFELDKDSMIEGKINYKY
ncbi:MAG: ubiquinol-cytochrome C chaperone family protein [Pelagibacteraceae bacterium]